MNITTIIRVVFAIPVASSKSERVFSVAGNTVTQKRTSLAPEKVENCVIVKSNMNLLREIGFRKLRYLTNVYIFCVFGPFHNLVIYKVPRIPRILEGFGSKFCF